VLANITRQKHRSRRWGEFVRQSRRRDEAEIRGHRRTYIGALPDAHPDHAPRWERSILSWLDEIDKLGMDFHGDPASALLKSLTRNKTTLFRSQFDALRFIEGVVHHTANDLEPLQPALLDRLEVIEFSGYTEEDKLAIARKFLIPKQREVNGLANIQLQFETSALETLIHEYTYEAGVRNLNREIANICRKSPARSPRAPSPQPHYAQTCKPLSLDLRPSMNCAPMIWTPSASPLDLRGPIWR
jgi:ATP-dependent Lon protease